MRYDRVDTLFSKAEDAVCRESVKRNEALSGCVFAVLEHQRKDPPHFRFRFVGSLLVAVLTHPSKPVSKAKRKREWQSIQHGRTRFKPSRIRAPGTVCADSLLSRPGFFFFFGALSEATTSYG